MPDQYETSQKAEDYEKFKKNFLVYHHIQVPSIRKLLDYDLSGKRVIDLACGSGDSTRILADLNPNELIGVDLSPAMIEHAKQLFSKENQSNSNFAKMKFYVKNCMEPLNLGQFDIVFSCHMLNYAHTREDLLKFYQNMSNITKYGGVCCGILDSPFVSRSDLTPGLYRKYNIDYEREEDDVNQSLSFYQGEQLLFKVNECIWPSGFHEECAYRAGFKSFEWIAPTLDEHFVDKDGFFDTYLTKIPTSLFKLSK
jgi:SAM-dependent methyltransferase